MNRLDAYATGAVRPRVWLLAAVLCLLAGASDLRAQSAADSAAIRAVALDYIEGWYAGDAARMARALHPELAKRIVAGSDLRHMTAEQLIAATRNGGGRNTPAAGQRKDVRILDVFRGTASVRVDAADWVDYMQVARWNGEWKIINVLWEMRAGR